jgi:hypothetical protein
MIDAKDIGQITFPGMGADEHVIFFTRRHPASVLSNILVTAFMVLIPILVWVGFDYLNAPKVVGGDPVIRGAAYFSLKAFSILLASIYYMSVLLFFIVWWMDYYFDILYVTNERLVDTEQRGLFDRVISEQSLLRVQDVTGEIKGILPTAFGYGDVIVQTAGAAEQFIIKNIPNPHEVARRVMELHENYSKEQEAHNAMKVGVGEEIKERRPISEAAHKGHTLSQRIGEMLVADGLITAAQLDTALKEQERSGDKLGSTLVKLGYISEEDLAAVLGEQTRYVPMDLSDVELDPNVVHLLPEHLARRHKCIAVAKQGKILTVACSNPHDEKVMAEIAEAIGYKVAPVISPEISIERAQDKYYGKVLPEDEK